MTVPVLIYLIFMSISSVYNSIDLKHQNFFLNFLWLPYINTHPNAYIICGILAEVIGCVLRRPSNIGMGCMTWLVHNE
jgi:hypothetical protein